MKIILISWLFFLSFSSFSMQVKQPFTRLGLELYSDLAIFSSSSNQQLRGLKIKRQRIGLFCLLDSFKHDPQMLKMSKNDKKGLVQTYFNSPGFRNTFVEQVIKNTASDDEYVKFGQGRTVEEFLEAKYYEIENKNESIKEPPVEKKAESPADLAWTEELKSTKPTKGKAINNKARKKKKSCNNNSPAPSKKPVKNRIISGPIGPVFAAERIDNEVDNTGWIVVSREKKPESSKKKTPSAMPQAKKPEPKNKAPEDVDNSAILMNEQTLALNVPMKQISDTHRWVDVVSGAKYEPKEKLVAKVNDETVLMKGKYVEFIVDKAKHLDEKTADFKNETANASEGAQYRHVRLPQSYYNYLTNLRDFLLSVFQQAQNRLDNLKNTNNLLVEALNYRAILIKNQDRWIEQLSSLDIKIIDPMQQMTINNQEKVFSMSGTVISGACEDFNSFAVIPKDEYETLMHLITGLRNSIAEDMQKLNAYIQDNHHITELLESQRKVIIHQQGFISSLLMNGHDFLR